MTDDRRSGDLIDALGKGLVIYYTFPLMIGLISGLGMVAGCLLAVPFYLAYWVGPEQFLAEHTGSHFSSGESAPGLPSS